MEQRKEREAAFHDCRYAEDTRDRALKYYSVARSSREVYRTLLCRTAYGKDVLEYGCGTGSRAIMLAKAGARVTGIDISPEAVELARERAGREHLGRDISFLVMDAEGTSFRGDSFDVVCGTGILHHLDLGRAYPEIVRVLRRDGRAIFLEPLGHNPLINAYRLLTQHMRTRDEHPLLMADARLAERYFLRVDLQFFHLFVLLGVPFRGSRKFQTVLRLLEAVDAAAFSSVPLLRKLAWAVLIVAADPRGLGGGVGDGAGAAREATRRDAGWERTAP